MGGTQSNQLDLQNSSSHYILERPVSSFSQRSRSKIFQSNSRSKLPSSHKSMIEINPSQLQSRNYAVRNQNYSHNIKQFEQNKITSDLSFKLREDKLKQQRSLLLEEAKVDLEKYMLSVREGKQLKPIKFYKKNHKNANINTHNVEFAALIAPLVYPEKTNPCAPAGVHGFIQINNDLKSSIDSTSGVLPIRRGLQSKTDSNVEFIPIGRDLKSYFQPSEFLAINNKLQSRTLNDSGFLPIRNALRSSADDNPEFVQFNQDLKTKIYKNHGLLPIQRELKSKLHERPKSNIHQNSSFIMKSNKFPEKPSDSKISRRSTIDDQNSPKKMYRLSSELFSLIQE